ncbi:MAG TPA: tail fiber domain-containing protein, partial [Longimicrobiaceae bacterium]
ADAGYAVAIGRAVSARTHTGAIVIGDGSTSDSLQATVDNQFNLRAAGGIRLYTNSTKTAGVLMQAYPGSASTPWTGCTSVQWVISASNCAYLSNSGVWTNNSDVNRKHGYAAVHGEDVLTRLRGMPITTWTYNLDGNEVRHMGPTAQDFHAAFGLNGADDTHIATVDPDGVAMAAAQALDARTTELRAQVRSLSTENAELRARVGDLEARLQRLESLVSAQQPPAAAAPRP